MAEYDASSIIVLNGLQAVRRRPGMYVGDTDNGSGLHNLLWGVLERAASEHRNPGGPSFVQVRFDGDRVTVDDDGAGMAVDYDRRGGCSALQTVFTELMAGDTGWTRSELAVGLVVVNALSAQLEVEVRRGGRRYVQSYRQGEPTAPLRDAGPTAGRGTTISFVPDFGIFVRTGWDRDAIAQRARTLSALLPNFTVLIDHTAYRAPRGLADGVRYLARDRAALLPEPMTAAGGDASMAVDLALQWAGDGPAQLVSFVNGHATHHGSHVEGLFDGLCAGLVQASGGGLDGVYPVCLRECLERGLHGMVHVELPNAQLTGCMRDEFDSEDARSAVHRVVVDALAREPAVARRLLSRLPG